MIYLRVLSLLSWHFVSAFSSLRIISVLNVLTRASSNFLTSGVTKKNRSHIIPRNYSSKKTIGGNAHENWNLIRILPFLIGDLIPEDELAWQVILDLKVIVELAVAPVHTDETIAYLDVNVSEHRQRLLQLNPVVKILPKHHYLEHYAHLIRCFGPLVGVWTIRFEAKHSFF